MRTTTTPSPRLRSRSWVIALTIGLLAGPVFADSAPQPTTTPSEPGAKPAVRVYTNADLAKLEPLPQQKAPLVADQGWDFVFSVLDRERELLERRQDRDRERERAREESSLAYQDYGYPWYGGYGGIYPPLGPYTVNAPSNPNASLSARGIRTAEDLYHESVEDAKIRHQSVP